MTKPTLGIWATTALVVGNIVGTGILMLPSSLAALGTAGILGWFGTTIGALFLALVFARLSRRFPKTGGPFAYTQYAFGDFVGFQMAWMYWTANWVSNAAVAIAFVSYLSIIYPQVATQPLVSLMLGLGAIWILTVLNLRGTQTFGRVQIFITLLKLTPLGFIAIVGLPEIKSSNIFPLTPAPGKDFLYVISHGISLTLFSFMGLEAATIPAQDVKNPEKTISRATIFGTLLAAVIYIWINIVALGILGADALAQAQAPFAQIAEQLYGQNMGLIVAGFGAFAAFATLNGWILLQGQIPMAAAQENLLPQIFATKNGQGVPWFSLVLSSTLASILLSVNYTLDFVSQFTFIVNLTTFTVLLPYLYTSVADVILLIESRKNARKREIFRASLISAGAFLYALGAIYGNGRDIVFSGTLFTLMGVPFYVWARQTKKSSYQWKQETSSLPQ
ncbi:MAG: amino acid permease [Alphaproteobacteria bacterium]|nr:MAG: amino acid permease [Alphaproteobacteria bacterium]